MAKSKYEPLKMFLSESGRAEIPMTFKEIEAIIGCKLPLKASGYRAWWSNNPSHNPMRRAWLDAGYKSESVDPKNRKLIFRQQIEATREIELWVGGGGGGGGQSYQNDHEDGGPLHVAFKGRLLAESAGLALNAIPEIRLSRTRTGKLVVCRNWRGLGGGNDEGATYLTFLDLKALAACPDALHAFWVEGDDRDGIDRPDLEQRLLRQAADALGEPLVIRID